jgi:hypothetical protein
VSGADVDRVVLALRQAAVDGASMGPLAATDVRRLYAEVARLQAVEALALPVAAEWATTTAPVREAVLRGDDLLLDALDELQDGIAEHRRRWTDRAARQLLAEQPPRCDPEAGTHVTPHRGCVLR